MRRRNHVLLVAFAVQISVFFSVGHVTAARKLVAIDGQVRTLDYSKAVPGQLNYQGCLLNAADSSAVTDTLEMTFRLYNTQTKGNQLWHEIHPMVEVSNGVFHVLLGSIIAFPADLFDGSILWLRTEVGTEVLTPRKPLVSVAYSNRAEMADDAAQLEGQTLADLDDRWVNEEQANSVTSDMISNGEVGTDDLANNAVTTGKIKNYTILGEDIANGAVGTTQLANNAVTTEKIKDGTIVGADINNGTTISVHQLEGGGITGNTCGVYGYSNSDDGVYGKSYSSSGSGVRGFSDKEYGVYGDGDDAGVVGYCSNGYGVRGDATSGYGGRFYGGSAGIYAIGGTYSAVFPDDVRVDGYIYKYGGGFKIDHPLDPANKYLYHSFVESPDMMNIYNGNIILNTNGEAWVEMPEWFEVVNQDFRYQLTAIGSPGPNLYIAERISNNRFKIAGGEPGQEVSWQVTGIRHDPYAEAHRIQVEVEKTGAERGKYLQPSEHGVSERLGINYEERQKAEMEFNENMRKAESFEIPSEP